MELNEVRSILDAPGNRGKDATTEDDLRQTLQALMMHQCIYRDWPLSGGPFRTVQKHRTFFERYVAAMVAELVFEHRVGMIAMRPATTQYGWRQTRLKKDETLVALALRYLYDEGMETSQMTEDGRVEVTTDHVHDLISTGVGATPPEESRLDDILQGLHRKGVVRLGKRDTAERLRPLAVLPGVRILVPDIYVQAVADWVAQGAPEGAGDVFDHLSARVAQGKDAASQDDAEDGESDPDAGHAGGAAAPVANGGGDGDGDGAR
jgi:hypothetical protein